MHKNDVLVNDIYDFYDDPNIAFQKALDTAKEFIEIDPKIEFKILYDSKDKRTSLILDRINRVELFAGLFGSGDVPGYLTEEDMSCIDSLTKKLPESGVLVEVGSFLGKSTSEWAKSFLHQKKDYKIIAIDSFNTTIEILNQLLKEGDFDIPECDSHLEMFRHYTKQYSNIRPLEAFFNEDFVFDHKVNCVFEDSDHSQRTLSFALPFWWDKIVSGGILCGHDYSIRDVKVSVDNFVIMNNLELHLAGSNSSIWWIEK